MKRGVRGLVSGAFDVAARQAARWYVAGPRVEDALQVCNRLAGQGFGTTTCYWNSDEDSPRRVTDEYLGALDMLSRVGFEGYLSLKPPAIQYDDALFGEVLERSARTGIRLHFDSHGVDSASPTFDLLERSLPHPPGLSCTLPGRWRRSRDDLERAMALGLSVRVVKGQWPDPAGGERDLRAGFLDIVDGLAGRASRVMVATHDPSTARPALRQLRAAGTPCELELLYGLPMRAAMDVAREEGVAARVYVPYGHGWLTYSVNQAKRNPRLMLWLLKDLAKSVVARPARRAAAVHPPRPSA
jgi:proline dehydrogenase